MRGQRESRPCAGCGKKLTKLVSQAKGQNWFCSSACQFAHVPPRLKHPNPHRGQQQTRPCAECGNPVTRYLRPENVGTTWTCSRGCMGKNQALRRMADGTWTKPRKPRRGDTVACLVCGEEFYRQPAYITQNRRYCSQPCWNVAQRTSQITKVCPQCGKEFSVRPSEKGITYCSRACMVVAKIKRPTGREHNGRPVIVNWLGYVTVYEPTHPAANQHNGRVLEHRLIMEQHMGRYLKTDEQVDHINRSKADNRIENLQLLSPAAHTIKTNGDRKTRELSMADQLAEYERRYGKLD